MNRLSCMFAVCVGCAASQQVVLPASLRDEADRYTVGGHVTLFQPKLVFGPYTAKARIYTSSKSRGATVFNGQTEKLEERDHGKFELHTASGMFHASCEQAEAAVVKHEMTLDYRSDRGWRVGDEARLVAASRIYGCAIGQPAGAELRLEQRSDGAGSIEGGDVHWAFAALGELDERPPIAAGLEAGYVLRDGERTLGVVTLGAVDASVTIARGLEQADRDRFAAVATALLLLRDM